MAPTKSAKRQQLVKVAGITGYWMTKTGGEITADTTNAYDGGALQPTKLAGPANASNVVLSRVYDTARDNTVVVQLKQLVGRYSSTISAQPTDSNLAPVGKPSVYPGALLVRLTEPELDAGSGDPGILELEFAVSGWQ